MGKRWKTNVTVAAVNYQNGRFLLVDEKTPIGLQLNIPAGHRVLTKMVYSDGSLQPVSLLYK